MALDDVSFNVHQGKVNVLIGENGAGKSTLMKILAGVERPTHGKILLDGREIHLHSPLDATRLGIGIIYQELNLCANLSVVDNIYLAREISQNGLIEQKLEKQHARELVKRLEQKIDPNALVGDLRIGQQQIVEIAKALAQDVRILIMDEPTSALSAAEVEVLFRVIRELKSQRRCDHLYFAQTRRTAPNWRLHHHFTRWSQSGRRRSLESECLLAD